jgi:thymidylate synthase
MQTKDIRDLFIDLYNTEKYVTDKTGVKTLEIVGASFTADEVSIFGTPNNEYIKREIDWYLSESLYVYDIPEKTPEIWKQISSTKGKINSNYGQLIFSKENHKQYNHVCQQLLCDPNSRRAVMIYQRPTMHDDFSVDGMSDFICTNAVQYMVRDNALHAVVQMRSNDVVFGYRNDYAWQKFVLDRLVKDLNDFGENTYSAGDITWQVGSLHVYERHFKFIDKEIEARKKADEVQSLAQSSMGDS